MQFETMMNDPEFVKQLTKVLNKKEYEQLMEYIRGPFQKPCLQCPCYYVEKLRVGNDEMALTGKFLCTLGPDLTEMRNRGQIDSRTHQDCPLRRKDNGEHDDQGSR